MKTFLLLLALALPLSGLAQWTPPQQPAAPTVQQTETRLIGGLACVSIQGSTYQALPEAELGPASSGSGSEYIYLAQTDIAYAERDENGTCPIENPHGALEGSWSSFPDVIETIYPNTADWCRFVAPVYHKREAGNQKAWVNPLTGYGWVHEGEFEAGQPKWDRGPVNHFVSADNCPPLPGIADD